MIQQSHSWASTWRKPQIETIHASHAFTIATTWKHPKCQLTDECIKNMWYNIQWDIPKP